MSHIVWKSTKGPCQQQRCRRACSISPQSQLLPHLCVDKGNFNVLTKSQTFGPPGWLCMLIKFFLMVSPRTTLVKGYSTQIYQQHLSLVTRKPVFRVCDQVRHKPVCAATEARQRLEISDVETRGIILSRQRKQRRWSNCVDEQADLHLCCLHMT